MPRMHCSSGPTSRKKPSAVGSFRLTASRILSEDKAMAEQLWPDLLQRGKRTVDQFKYHIVVSFCRFSLGS